MVSSSIFLTLQLNHQLTGQHVDVIMASKGQISLPLALRTALNVRCIYSKPHALECDLHESYSLAFLLKIAYLSTFNLRKSGDFTWITIGASFAAFCLVPILATRVRIVV